MTEDERLINYRCGYGYPDPGVIISAPNQVYFYGRTDYTWTEEEGGGEEVINDADFDIENTPAPEGYAYLEVWNLRGGSVDFEYTDLEENDQVTTISESFAIFEKTDEVSGNQIFLTSTGIEALEYLVDVDGSLRKPGYILADVEETEREDDSIVYDVVWYAEADINDSDFDTTTPVPEGYECESIVNLHGGYTDLRYVDLEGYAKRTRIFESFALYRNTETNKYLTSTGIAFDHFYQDLSSNLWLSKKPGYALGGIEEEYDDSTNISTMDLVWAEVQSTSGNTIVMSTYPDSRNVSSLALGDTLDCSENTSIVINNIEETIAGIHRRDAEGVYEEENGPSYLISITSSDRWNNMYIHLYSEDGQHFEFVKFAEWFV